MRNYDENDDPIREVGGRGFFSKIKNFENDLEYKVQKEMEEFEKYLDEEKKREASSLNNSSYSNNNYSNYNNIDATSVNISNTVNKMLGIYFTFIIGFFVFFMFTILKDESSARLVKESPTNYNSQVELTTEEIYEDIKISKLEYITFDDGTQIPTLHRFDKKTEAFACDFSELDSRYKNVADTLEIQYLSIPARSLELLEQSLIRRNYEYIGDDANGRVFVLSTEEGCIFVVTSDKRIIYGCANCTNITYNY